MFVSFVTTDVCVPVKRRSQFWLTTRSRVLVQEHTDLSDAVVVQVEVLQRCIRGCVRPCRAETVTDTFAVAQKAVLHAQKDNRCC